VSESVKEETGREAIDRVVSGVIDTQKQLRVPVPDVAKAEAFAKKVVDETIKKHEERQAKPEPPAPIGDVHRPLAEKALAVPGTQEINRDVSLSDWTAPQGKAHVAGITPPRPLEDMLLEARVNMLGQFPEWAAKLHAAAAEADALSIKRKTSDWKEIQSLRADFMMKVIEQSNAIFGDYLKPNQGRTKIILTPK